MNLDKLFLLCVSKVARENGEQKVQWEDIIKKCFEVFPEEFSLVKYKDWPDTWKIHNCMWRCRNQRQWIDGNNKLGYFLTDLGKEIVKTIENKKIKTGDIKERKEGIGTDYMLIKNIKDSDAYKKFLGGENDLDEQMFRHLLRCTLESTKRTLKQNFRYIRQSAEKYNEKKIIDFLDRYKQKFKELFE
jgi:hypothetical protein